MTELPITWKCLVKDGETCQRCGSTQHNVVSAITKLEAVLQPLGIRPVLETLTLDDKSFRADPSESNRIWIGGKPMAGCGRRQEPLLHRLRRPAVQDHGGQWQHL